MVRPRALDLFCGGFGAGHGYQRAGFDVTGVDIVQRADHPDGVRFIKGDAAHVLADLDYLRTFDLIHASPPCKVHTRLGHLMAAQGGSPVHGDLVALTRTALEAARVPYIIENVEGAPLRPDVVLCGSMLGLHTTDTEGRKRWLRRHRIFELGGWGHLGWGLQPEWCCDCQSGCSKPMCGHRVAGYRAWGVYGTLDDHVPDGGETPQTLAQARELMGIPWMGWGALTQAIPPAYTDYLGTVAREELGL